MVIVVHTPPAAEPLTVAEVEIHCRIDSIAAEVGQLEMLITSARLSAEHELRRYLITQTLDAYFDGFPGEILLPPIQSVESIRYIDGSGNEQSLSGDQYLVDSKSIPARVLPAYGAAWPETRLQPNAVSVRFIAGYGDADDVPACIKQWMLLRIKHVYDNPGTASVGTIAPMFSYSLVDGLLDPERVMGRI